MGAIRNGKVSNHEIDLAQYSRRARTEELAQLFDELIELNGAASPADT
jgi:hypothetical protein